MEKCRKGRIKRGFNVFCPDRAEDFYNASKDEKLAFMLEAKQMIGEYSQKKNLGSGGFSNGERYECSSYCRQAS